ncbi:oxygenase MpaB family protein [Tsukamurella strandjordii]|uniref:oxygenase MpaB family protein n=1 Tax=Tsukamurella strandjordii TaxID=147577 RepID=UPI0031D5548A
MSSILLRHLDSRRFRLALPRAVALQVLHPSIAAAFTEHVSSSLWGHKQRTVGPLVRMAYRGEKSDWIIRFAHEHVKGVDSTGERYHALTPELFHFQHATYVDAVVAGIETYAGPLTAAEHEQLYRECCDWYRAYGISTRPMPTTWEGFTEYFADACAGLRLTPEGRALGPQALSPPRWAFGTIPGFAARGIQHERARELLDVPMSAVDRLAFDAFAAAQRRVA